LVTMAFAIVMFILPYTAGVFMLFMVMVVLWGPLQSRASSTTAMHKAPDPALERHMGRGRPPSL
ncbi:hypothetical protein ACFWGV_21860, partial [Bacillus subtilis]